MVEEEDAAAEHFHDRHAGGGMHGRSLLRVMKSAESKPLMGTGTSFFFRRLFLHILSQADILHSFL